MKGIRLAAIVVTAILSASAQTGKKPPIAKASNPKPRPGSVTGRIFAITRAGDLKPARFAKVNLFLLSAGDDGPPQTAGDVWETEYSNVISTLKDKIRDPQTGRVLTEAELCQQELLLYDQATLAALTWVTADPRRIRNFISAQADEEGNFEIKGIPVGAYLVIAEGHAGLNDARWRQSLAVDDGSQLFLKLASPDQSCLVTA